MKVILQRDVPKKGKIGDVVDVKDGYARNYLLPRSYAVPATGGALKEHNARVEREKERGARMLESAQADAEKLQGRTLTIVGRAGTAGRLYGSITAQDVADAISREVGVKVDKRRIGLLDPIKALGTYTIPIRLHGEVSVPVRVEVVTAEELERRKNQPAPEPPPVATDQAVVSGGNLDATAEEPVANAETPADADTGESADGAAAESAGEELPDTVEPVASEVTE